MRCKGSHFDYNQQTFSNFFQLMAKKSGNHIFGEVGADSGMTAAPIKLSVGENVKDDNGANDGYGLLHIEAGHGEQIRAAGFASVEEFVEAVARNYNTIREGGIFAGNHTYLWEISDGHNNTLFIQLSRDGSYWNVNSAGICKKKYSRRKQEVFTRPALEPDTNTDTSGVDSGQANGVTTPAGNSPQTSESKVGENPASDQAKGGKVTENQSSSGVQAALSAAEHETNTEPSEAQKGEALTISQDSVQAGVQAGVQAPAEEKPQEGQKMVDKQRADREGTGQPTQKESKKGNGTKNAQQNKKQPANQSAMSKEKIDGNPRPLDKQEAAMRDALVGLLRGAGVEVVTDAQEGQRVLDEANGETRLQAKKEHLKPSPPLAMKGVNKPSFQVLTERRY